MSEVIIYNMTADLIRSSSNYIIIEAPQGGIGERYIDVFVVDNGQPYALPSPTMASYVCKGSNGGGANIMVTCSVVNDKIRIPISESMVASAGIGKYRVDIYDIAGNQAILATFTFNISVERDPLNATTIIQSDDYIYLKNLIDRAEGDLSNWLIGEGLPDNSSGKNLDLYLDSSSGKVYKKVSNTWIYQGTLGSNMYIAYATDSSGSGFSTSYTGTQSYLGVTATQAETQPLDPSVYTWIMISGGDNMKVSDYGGSDENTVAQADRIKGEVLITGIVIPANTTTATTTVTVNDENISGSSILEDVYTTSFGLNPISATLGFGTLTMVFPALSTANSAIVKIWNADIEEPEEISV